MCSPDLCVLLETRLSGQGLDHARHCFPPSWRFYVVESRGLAGEIMVVWRPSVAKIDVLHRSSQQVCIVISKMNCNSWFLSDMHASTDYRVQGALASGVFLSGAGYSCFGDRRF